MTADASSLPAIPDGHVLWKTPPDGPGKLFGGETKSACYLIPWTKPLNAPACFTFTGIAYGISIESVTLRDR